MKKITLLLSAISAFAFSTASAQYNVTVTSTAGGGFDNAPAANLILPAEVGRQVTFAYNSYFLHNLLVVSETSMLQVRSS